LTPKNFRPEPPTADLGSAVTAPSAAAAPAASGERSLQPAGVDLAAGLERRTLDIARPRPELARSESALAPAPSALPPAPVSRWVTALWIVVGVASLVYYLQWLLRPERVGVAPLYALLVAADLFNAFHALSFWATCARDRRRERRREPLPGEPRVDVFVPTVDEPLAIVERTLRAARAMRGARVRVVVLDDGHRPQVRALAARLGIDYLARRDRVGAKAGNLNAALAVTAADGAPFFCVFDCDHVPAPHFLERTLPELADPDVAIVQTPQVYGNAGLGPLTAAASEQQALFFGPISRGRDRFGASFCCGTNFVARRDAVVAVGGFPEDSLTEDIVLSADLAARGLRTVYVDEPLAVGLGPEDLPSYVSQQLRWATGCLELLFRRPRLWLRLGWAQRWQFLVATTYWLSGCTILVYLTLPILRLAFGWQAIGEDAAGFITHFAPYFLACVVNLGRLSEGMYTFRALALAWSTAWIHLLAALRALVARGLKFRVTPKEGRADLPLRLLAPALVWPSLLVAAALHAAGGGLTPGELNNVTFGAIGATLVATGVWIAWRQTRALACRSDVAPRTAPVPLAETAGLSAPAGREPLARPLTPAAGGDAACGDAAVTSPPPGENHGLRRTISSA